MRGIAPVRPVVKVGAAPASPPEAPKKDKKESDMGPQVDKLIEVGTSTSMQARTQLQAKGSVPRCQRSRHPCVRTSETPTPLSQLLIS